MTVKFMNRCHTPSSHHSRQSSNLKSTILQCFQPQKFISVNVLFRQCFLTEKYDE